MVGTPRRGTPRVADVLTLARTLVWRRCRSSSPPPQRTRSASLRAAHHTARSHSMCALACPLWSRSCQQHPSRTGTSFWASRSLVCRSAPSPCLPFRMEHWFRAAVACGTGVGRTSFHEPHDARVFSCTFMRHSAMRRPHPQRSCSTLIACGSHNDIHEGAARISQV